jgi:geranylgeranyl pyrophosphate synthase
MGNNSADKMTLMNFMSMNIEKINNEIDCFLADNTTSLEIKEPYIREFYNLIREYSKGGKRLRPLALLMAYTGCKGNRDIFLPAISVELHHTYSLILDDIMDEDDSRRGKPSVHSMLRSFYLKKFKEKEYDGSLFNKKSSRFATSFAIMLGNITNLLSQKAIISSELPQNTKYAALKIMNHADFDIYHGQMMDLLTEEKEYDEAFYLEMIRLKTAVLFGISFKLGALFAGADIKEQKLMISWILVHIKAMTGALISKKEKRPC